MDRSVIVNVFLRIGRDAFSRSIIRYLLSWWPDQLSEEWFV